MEITGTAALNITVCRMSSLLLILSTFFDDKGGAALWEIWRLFLAKTYFLKVGNLKQFLVQRINNRLIYSVA